VYFAELAAEAVFGVAAKAVKLSRTAKANSVLRSLLNMVVTKNAFLIMMITLRRRKKAPIE
jgi:hypothetical protein